MWRISPIICLRIRGNLDGEGEMGMRKAFTQRSRSREEVERGSVCVCV